MAKYQIRHEPTFCCFIGKALLWLWHKDFKFEAKEHIFYTGIDRTTEGSLLMEIFTHFLHCHTSLSLLGVPFKDRHSRKQFKLKTGTALNGSI